MTRMPTPRIHRLAASVAAVSLVAVFASSALAAATGYDKRLAALVQTTKEDPTYKRLPLDSAEDKQWFTDATEKLYAHKMTKEEYVAEGAKRFPGYESSLNTVADFMTK
jgi:hypothetical protein